MLLSLCILSVATLLLAEHRHHAPARAVAKMVASLCFVGWALSLGALDSVYGRWVLLALVLSLVGDALLLSERAAAFLAGLGAFLLGHAAYSVAFAGAGVSMPALAGAAVAAVALGAGVMRWLGPGLGPSYRGPVVAYVAVILVMVSLAVGHAAHSGRWGVAVGALVFAASDLAVARQKFVRAAFVNKAWGLPAYYAAQWMLAGTVAG